VLYEQQQFTRDPPKPEDGGDWTFFDARLADGTPFVFGQVHIDLLRQESPLELQLLDRRGASSARAKAHAGLVERLTCEWPRARDRYAPLTWLPERAWEAATWRWIARHHHAY
jgi:hypothetical protein